jgi:hypothetical protein
MRYGAGVMLGVGEGVGDGVGVGVGVTGPRTAANGPAGVPTGWVATGIGGAVGVAGEVGDGVLGELKEGGRGATTGAAVGGAAPDAAWIAPAGVAVDGGAEGLLVGRLSAGRTWVACGCGIFAGGAAVAKGRGVAGTVLGVAGIGACATAP